MAGSRVVGRSAPLTVAARGDAPAPCPCAGVSPCGAGPAWASVLGGRALQHTQTDVGCPPGPRLRLAGALLPWPPSACEGPRTGSHQLTAGPLPEAVWPLLLPLAEPASGASAPGPPRPDGLLQTGDASPVWPGLGRVSSHTPPHAPLTPLTRATRTPLTRCTHTPGRTPLRHTHTLSLGGGFCRLPFGAPSAHTRPACSSAQRGTLPGAPPWLPAPVGVCGVLVPPPQSARGWRAWCQPRAVGSSWLQGQDLALWAAAQAPGPERASAALSGVSDRQPLGPGRWGLG